MGYGNPPWEFKGQALYQLSLVKVEEARKYVPPELRLVNFFGWTLGGFYLARYTQSPVGAFEELVALAGLVWDFPTSCAWAARVYVNNKEARDHGISSVGLPSRLAKFKAIPLSNFNHRGGSTNKASSHRAWWNVAAQDKKESLENGAPVIGSMELFNVEPRRKDKSRGLKSPVCEIAMPHVPDHWAPRIQMFLPSFSGATPEHPSLLKYSLTLLTHIRFLKPVTLKLPEERHHEDHGSEEVIDVVLRGRPLVCMAFENMEMEVQAPKIWPEVREISVERMRGKLA